MVTIFSMKFPLKPWKKREFSIIKYLNKILIFYSPCCLQLPSCCTNQFCSTNKQSGFVRECFQFFKEYIEEKKKKMQESKLSQWELENCGIGRKMTLKQFLCFLYCYKAVVSNVSRCNVWSFIKNFYWSDWSDWSN